MGRGGKSSALQLLDTGCIVRFNANAQLPAHTRARTEDRTINHTPCPSTRTKASGRAATGLNQSAGTLSQALQHETRLKASLLEQVQAARNDGASFDELAAMVAKLEAAPLGV